MLPTRRLGTQGLEVSALGLGCMGMSQSYGTPDDQESVATLHRALELGVTFLDTAEAYGPFTNEELLGRALKGRRERVSARHQVRLPVRGQPADRHRQPAGAHPRGGRGVAATAAHRSHRPALPASGGSRRADRGRGRRHGAPGGGGQGAVPGPLGGGGDDDPPRPRGASDLRAPERVQPVGAQPRGRRASRPSRAGDRAGPVQPAGARVPHRDGQAGRGVSGGRLPQGRSTIPGRQLRREHAGGVRRA